MYNGVGLTTVRGSGTNGYVQKNMAHVSRKRNADAKGYSDRDKNDASRMLKDPRKADEDIMEHNRKRAVESKCYALQDSLEEEGLPADEVERKVSALRESLLAKLPKPGAAASSGAGGRAGETHADAERKASEAKALKSALGIQDGYVPGSAFDRELQEQLKAERQAKREAEEQARLEMEEELEREREREEKRKRKEARRAEKEKERAERKDEKRRRRAEEDDEA